MTKKFLAVILTASFVLGFSGCRKNEAQHEVEFDYYYLSTEQGKSPMI